MPGAGRKCGQKTLLYKDALVIRELSYYILAKWAEHIVYI